jgi:ElaB protein
MDQTESRSQGLGTNEGHEVRNGIDHSATRAGTAAHETVDKLAGAARPAVDKLAGSAHQAVDKMTSLASSAAETFEQKRIQLNTASAELVDNARTYVRANPIAAISIAAAVGFILSRVMKSR